MYFGIAQQPLLMHFLVQRHRKSRGKRRQCLLDVRGDIECIRAGLQEDAEQRRVICPRLPQRVALYP